MLCELGMPSVPSLFPIPRIQQTLDEGGIPLVADLDRRLSQFAAEFECYAGALRAARLKGTPY
jgi:hypothetical protein